mmetsp:Transcript_46126/g.115494  ORF Transcript_46126/g.115494 Transcript_46126/m.115494 type:complete len:337 (-) Transcript_46126:91-1101(-)
MQRCLTPGARGGARKRYPRGGAVRAEAGTPASASTGLPAALHKKPAQAPGSHSPPSYAALLSRRGALGLAAAAGLLTGLPCRASAAPDSGRTLQPLPAYIARLEVALGQLAQVRATLASWAAADSDSSSSSEEEGEDGEAGEGSSSSSSSSCGGEEGDCSSPSPAGYGTLQAALHEGELGAFWASARGADRYIGAGLPGARGALAREQADLFSLLPEAAGPLGALLRPAWDDPDDRLCLIYSCVNDPNAPPSINALYALKLLHVGLGLGARADARVSPQGLLFNVDDAIEKIEAYLALARAAGDAIPADRLSPEGALLGATAPGPSADRYGPSPLG